jgi:hypothetical protein
MGSAKEVHPGVARARHQDGPAAHCSDDIVVAHPRDACLAARRDEPVPVPKEVRRGGLDNVARLTARQQGAVLQERLLRDVLRLVRFPVPQRAAEERQAAGRPVQVQPPVVRLLLELVRRVQMSQASPPQELRQSDASPDEPELQCC